MAERPMVAKKKPPNQWEFCGAEDHGYYWVQRSSRQGGGHRIAGVAGNSWLGRIENTVITKTAR